MMTGLNWRYWWRRLTHDPYYWVIGRFWYQYNTVRSKYLPFTWNDRDQVLLFVSFQTLEDFIEKEQPWEMKEVDRGPRHVWISVYAEYIESLGGAPGADEEARRRATLYEEMATLYLWWKERRVADYGIDLHEEDQYEKDNEMLKRLIDIRKALWT